MKFNEEVVRNLNFLVKSYDALTETVAGIKNRYKHLNTDGEPKYDDVLKKLDSQKNIIKTRIGNELEFFPLWTEWLKGVPGIGASLAGRLIVLYYFRFVPICKECGSDLIKKEGSDGKVGFFCSGCGRKAKGDGVLQTRIELKDFNKISSWWKYMGRHVVKNDDGVGGMPKRKKGEKSDWSTVGRTVGFHIGESFVKTGGKYRAFYDRAKEEYQGFYPDKTDMHRHNLAKNKMIKLFLSHLWQVARELDGLPVTEPYAIQHLGHAGIIKPFYWSKPVDG